MNNPAIFTSILACFLFLGPTICAADELSKGQPDQAQLRAILEALQDKKYLSTQSDEYRTILTGLLAMSHLKLKLNINNGYPDGSLNFILLASDVNERVDLPVVLFSDLGQDILHNCNYVGISNTIVCSQDFLDSFYLTYLKDYADVKYMPSKRPPRKDALTPITAHRAFLFWVLGHEIGHLLDDDVDSHFGTSLGLQEFTTPDELQQDKELRADTYCASLAVQHYRTPIVYVTVLEQILIALANDEVITRHLTRGEGPGLLQNYSDRDLIEYKNQGSHPEYVIRAVRLLSVLGTLTKDAGLIAMTTSFQAHLRQTTTPQPQ